MYFPLVNDWVVSVVAAGNTPYLYANARRRNRGRYASPRCHGPTDLAAEPSQSLRTGHEDTVWGLINSYESEDI